MKAQNTTQCRFITLLFKIERNVGSIRSRGKHDRIVYTRTRSIVRSSFTEGGIFFHVWRSSQVAIYASFSASWTSFFRTRVSRERECAVAVVAGGKKRIFHASGTPLGPFSHRLKRLKLSIERTSGSAVLTSLPVSSHHYESEIIIDGKVGEGS